jgi:hypothetical protein
MYREPRFAEKDVLVSCTYAGTESIRISGAIDENVRWRTTDSIVRRERSWSDALRVRGLAWWLGNPG